MKRCDQTVTGGLGTFRCPLPFGHPTLECRACTAMEDALWQQRDTLLEASKAALELLDPRGDRATLVTRTLLTRAIRQAEGLVP